MLERLHAEQILRGALFGALCLGLFSPFFSSDSELRAIGLSMSVVGFYLGFKKPTSFLNIFPLYLFGPFCILGFSVVGYDFFLELGLPFFAKIWVALLCGLLALIFFRGILKLKLTMPRVENLGGGYLLWPFYLLCVIFFMRTFSLWSKALFEAGEGAILSPPMQEPTSKFALLGNENILSFLLLLSSAFFVPIGAIKMERLRFKKELSLFGEILLSAGLLLIYIKMPFSFETDPWFSLFFGLHLCLFLRILVKKMRGS